MRVPLLDHASSIHDRRDLTGVELRAMQRTQGRDFVQDPFEPVTAFQSIHAAGDLDCATADSNCEFDVHQQSNTSNPNCFAFKYPRTAHDHYQCCLEANVEQGPQTSACTGDFAIQDRAGSQETSANSSGRPPRPSLAETRAQCLREQGFSSQPTTTYSRTQEEQPGLPHDEAGNAPGSNANVCNYRSSREQFDKILENPSADVQQSCLSNEAAKSMRATCQRPPRPTLCETTKLLGLKHELEQSHENASVNSADSKAHHMDDAKEWKSQFPSRPPRPSLSELSAGTLSVSIRNFRSHPGSDQCADSIQQERCPIGRQLTSAAYQRPPRQSLTETFKTLNGSTTRNVETLEHYSQTIWPEIEQSTPLQFQYYRPENPRPPRPSLSETTAHYKVSDCNRQQQNCRPDSDCVARDSVQELQREQPRSAPVPQIVAGLSTSIPIRVTRQIGDSERVPRTNGAGEIQNGVESAIGSASCRSTSPLTSFGVNTRTQSTPKLPKRSLTMPPTSNLMQYFSVGDVNLERILRPSRPSLGEASPAGKLSVRREFPRTFVSVTRGEVEAEGTTIRTNEAGFPHIKHRDQRRPSLSETLVAPEY